MDDKRSALLSSFQKMVGRILHRSMRGYREHARHEGLSMTQMFALRHLHYGGPCNVSRISERLGVTHAASSQMLDQLVEQGLVFRGEEPGDRRNKHVALTRKGAQLLVKSNAESLEWSRQWLSRLTSDEMKKVAEALELLNEKMASLDTD